MHIYSQIRSRELLVVVTQFLALCARADPGRPTEQRVAALPSNGGTNLTSWSRMSASEYVRVRSLSQELSRSLERARTELVIHSSPSEWIGRMPQVSGVLGRTVLSRQAAVCCDACDVGVGMKAGRMEEESA